jgi:hypothetical protein
MKPPDDVRSGMPKACSVFHVAFPKPFVILVPRENPFPIPFAEQSERGGLAGLSYAHGWSP